MIRREALISKRLCEARRTDGTVRRALLCLFGLGTDIGLKWVGSQRPNVNFEELRYVKRHFAQIKDALRAAIATIGNGTYKNRQSVIW